MGLRFVQLCDGESYAQPSDDNYERITYSKSLDALMPVWQKLGKVYLHFVTQYNEIHIEVEEIEIGFAKGETIQEAAAIATAKAIQELEA